MENRKLALDFLKQHKIAVIATVNQQSLPEASIVAFAINDDFQIFLASYDSARKVINLQRNPVVAIVVGWEQGKTVQLEGKAEEITDAEEIKELEWKILADMPTVAKYVKPERAVFYKIKPHWLKYANYAIEPWDRFELKFI